MRAARLLALLLVIQRTGRATAAQLAEELEVSARTIYRDVATLQAAGVPLWTETGPGGGVRLTEGWRSPLDGLTTPEAAALLIGPSVAADLGLGAGLVAARSKLRSGLPDGARQAAERITERFHLDVPGWFQRADDLPHLPAVAEAVWADRRLDLRYRRGDDTVDRRLDPLGLVCKAGTWYLVAAHRGRPRTYRVSRVVDVALRPDDPAERPDGFDLAAWWAASAVDFDAGIRPLAARLRLTAAAVTRLPHAVPGPATDAALAARSEPDAEGRCTVELPLEPLAAAVAMLAPVVGVEVLHPPALRSALADHARSVLAANAPG